MSSSVGPAAWAAGLPLRLLPTGAANPPPVLVDDSEIPRWTGPGAAGALVGGGVSGGGVSGGGVLVGGGGVSATRRAGRILIGAAGLGGSGGGGGGGFGSTGRGFTVSMICTSTRSERWARTGSAQAQANRPR